MTVSDTRGDDASDGKAALKDLGQVPAEVAMRIPFGWTILGVLVAVGSIAAQRPTDQASPLLRQSHETVLIVDGLSPDGTILVYDPEHP